MEQVKIAGEASTVYVSQLLLRLTYSATHVRAPSSAAHRSVPGQEGTYGSVTTLDLGAERFYRLADAASGAFELLYGRGKFATGQWQQR
jgi:hypothetical protein